MAMKSINRFFYGPTPEEKVKAWQQQLKTESRQLDREIMHVRTIHYFSSSRLFIEHHLPTLS